MGTDDSSTSHQDHAIKVRFNTQRGAERFLNYLENSSNWVERMQKKVDNWQAQEMREIQQRARKAGAEEARVESGDSHACKWMAWGSGVAATGLALAPVTGGASFVVGTFAAGTGVGDLAGLC